MYVKATYVNKDILRKKKKCVVEGSQDPFACPTPKLSITQEEPPRTERRELLDPAPWLNNVISAFGHGVSGARRDASSFGRSEDLETQKNIVLFNHIHLIFVYLVFTWLLKKETTLEDRSRLFRKSERGDTKTIFTNVD